MSDKGEYRAIYASIVDDPAFQALSPNAKLIFFFVKLQLGPSGIGVLYPAALAEQCGIPSASVGDGMAELSAGGDHAWVRVERNVVWIRNGLKYEPNLTITNDKHRKSVESHLRSLPKLAIVNDFAAYYGLPVVHSLTPPPPTHGNGIGNPMRNGMPIRDREREKETETTTLSNESGAHAPRAGDGGGVIDLAERRPSERPAAVDPALLMMPFVRSKLRRGQPYPGRTHQERRRAEARDLDVLRELLKAGRSPADIADALRGAVWLRDSGALQKRGWVRIDEPMTCRILMKAGETGPSFWEEAIGAARRDPDEDDERQGGGLQPVVVEIPGLVA